MEVRQGRRLEKKIGGILLTVWKAVLKIISNHSDKGLLKSSPLSNTKKENAAEGKTVSTDFSLLERCHVSKNMKDIICSKIKLCIDAFHEIYQSINDEVV